MKFQHYDLGNRKAGEIVQVTLSGNAANVLLMDFGAWQERGKDGESCLTDLTDA